MQTKLVRLALVALIGLWRAEASAQDAFEGCVPAAEGTAFSVTRPGAPTPVKGVILGRGARAVVFSNTAYNAPCNWLPTARELVAKGYQVALWTYAGAGLEQIGDLSGIVAELRRRGAEKVVLVGGSRGGCLSMMAAAEIGAPVAGVVMLSCAAVFNRSNPTPTAAWVAKLNVPVLLATAENDAIPTLDEARREHAAFAVQDKQLIIVPRSGAHGDQLLIAPDTAAAVKPQVLGFIDRVTGR